MVAIIQSPWPILLSIVSGLLQTEQFIGRAGMKSANPELHISIRWWPIWLKDFLLVQTRTDTKIVPS